jgi:hypothetical protein
MCFKRWCVLSALFALLAPASGFADGTAMAQTVHGSACQPSNRFHEDWYVYEGQALVNTGAGPGGGMIATCSLSEIVPGWWVDGVRVILRDERNGGGWCRVVNAYGEEIFEGYPAFDGSGEGVLAVPGSVIAPWRGLLDATIHCVVPPQASVELISIVWLKD